MTTVYHREYYDRLVITIEGHSGYGFNGEDIVCAAVSALGFTLLNCVLDEEAAENIRVIRNIVRDGYIHIEFIAFDFSKERIKGMLDACLTGFYMLEESYPDYIRVK
ncbi:MAG: ribosomal-processing cysteine protease Prp [Clostridia bacterium]|nr:ribosomal-processing cysteine protease Prp [Clostridia bacterium]